METSPIENKVPSEEVKTVDKNFIEVPGGTTIDTTGLTSEEIKEIIEQLREALNER